MIKNRLRSTKGAFLITVFIFIEQVKSNFFDLKIYTTMPNPEKLKVNPYWDPRLNGEYNVAMHLIKDGDVLFDVGANFGTHVNKISNSNHNLLIYAFEPVPITFLFLKRIVTSETLDAYKVLETKWGHFLKEFSFEKIDNINKTTIPNEQIKVKNNNKIYLMNAALSNSVCISDFYVNLYAPAIAGLDNYNKNASKISVQVETIDYFCKKNNINKINYLKIDTEGNDYLVLQGAQNLLLNKGIDFIQFEYTSRCKNSNWKLEIAYNYLKSFGYQIFKIVPDGIVLIDTWQPTLEDYLYANYLAVAI